MKIKQIFALRAAVLALFLTAACGNDLNTAQGIAEEFVDHHYVKIDLQKAKQYTVSVAQAKIDEEIRLTGGQTIDASTQKPRVNYTLLEKKKATNGRPICSKAKFSPKTARRSPASGPSPHARKAMAGVCQTSPNLIEH